MTRDNRLLGLLTAAGKKLMGLGLSMAILASTLCPMPAQAADSDVKQVRVGWYQSDMFQEGTSESEPKSGYSYDYLQKISDYTSWEYEYVYGSWTELYEKLENGEIDFLGGVSITDERKGRMLFPDSEMGTEEYCLCKKSSDSSISASNLTTLNGKKVGLIYNNLMSEYTEEWIQAQGLDITPVYFESFEERDAALDDGQVDLKTTTMDTALATEQITEVAKVGEEPYYMAISASRTDLLEEFNSALATVMSVDPYALQSLQYKNYGTALSGKELTDAEKQWLKDHGTVTVGYLDDYLPYSDKDDHGNVQGLVTDALVNAFEALGLTDPPQLRYVAFSSYEEMLEALNGDKIDIAFPVSDDLWQLEQAGIHASSRVVSDSGSLFYKAASQKNDIQKIAVNQNNSLQIGYSQSVYPDAELVYYSNIDECLKSVLNGETDGTIMDTMRVQYVTANEAYNGLTYVQLSTSTGKCFGVKHGNTDLLLILNRAIKVLGTSYGIDYSYRYIASFYSYEFGDFVKAHLLEVFVVASVCVALIIALLVRNVRKKEREVLEKEQLRKRAESADRAKSVFLFNMSHDIRTPMNAILGFATLMEKELDQPNRLKVHLDKIRISGQYLLNLINNVLEVARIDSGEETLDENITDLADEKTFVLFENDIEKKQLSFSNKLDVEHQYVYADGHKLQEILSNLLSNAVKYTPDGGKVAISLREEPCDKPGYATYVYEVSDTGIGMSEDFQEQIFESFSRERNTTEGKVAGTGLGMFIVKKLTDLMGGTVEVTSTPGIGSTFTVTLQLRIARNAAKAPQEIASAENADLDLSGLRILLAEDNDLNAEIAIAILEDAGAKVDRAEDGIVCVDMLTSAPSRTYDLILMDIQMPNLDGHDATRRIRSLGDPQKANIPVVAITANAFEEDRRAAIEAGMNGHIAKPFSIDEIGKTIGEVLAGAK